MSHVDTAHIDLDEIVNAEPIKVSSSLKKLMYIFILIGTVTMIAGLWNGDVQHTWGVYYVNLIFFMGLAAGSCMIPAMFQIVRAIWSPAVRRIAEANSAFLPYAYLLFVTSYLGKEYLFPWARAPMPGREWWMQADFVYLRFMILFGLLYFLIIRFVRLSLRGDIGLIKERAKDKNKWSGWPFDGLVKGWSGAAAEVKSIQPKLSWNAPLLIAVYAVVSSLFAFEMIMGMDTVWYSNMFGGFIFIGNIYVGWAVLSITVSYLKTTHAEYGRLVKAQQLWDLGKLTYGFCILWAYLFFSQFLPQWYGNLPEETQWMILRTREYPWKGLGWTVLSMCFILPFILLISRDVKKTPFAISFVCSIIAVGIWLERYIIVMPQLSPGAIPFGLIEIGVTMGFIGIYVLSISNFLGKFPYAPLSHPLTYGQTDW
jgi:hypothetical protein